MSRIEIWEADDLRIRCEVISKAMRPHLFLLQIFHQKTAYSGQVSREYMDDQAESLDMDKTDFRELTLLAMTGRKQLNRFQYQLVIPTAASQQNVTFRWKQAGKDPNVKMILGSIDVTEMKDSEAYAALLSTVSDSIGKAADYESRIDRLADESDKLHQELALSVKRLSHSSKLLEKRERQMLAQFSTILNSKKDKIEQLYQTQESVSPSKMVVDDVLSGSDTDEEKEKLESARNGEVSRRKQQQQQQQQQQSSSSKAVAGQEEMPIPKKRGRKTKTSLLQQQSPPKVSKLDEPVQTIRTRSGDSRNSRSSAGSSDLFNNLS